jgi:hypothetical protein
METTFKFSEETYQQYLTRIQIETGLKLTEYEAGLCRAILDIRSENSIGGACLGSKFKAETKRFLKEGLIHKPTFQFTGVCVPAGKLASIIRNYLHDQNDNEESKCNHNFEKDGFFDHTIRWKCTKCGFEKPITNNI